MPTFHCNQCKTEGRLKLSAALGMTASCPACGATLDLDKQGGIARGMIYGIVLLATYEINSKLSGSLSPIIPFAIGAADQFPDRHAVCMAELIEMRVVNR